MTTVPIPADAVGGGAPRVVVATGNDHKLREIAAILAACNLDVELVSMRAYGVPVPVEDGETFEDNALLKAKACAAATGLPSLADDSGLEVDALGGAPGVYSARYAGEPSDDAANNAKLVAELSALPDASRAARFVCAAAVVTADGRHHVVRGTMEGHVVWPARGAGGFGYDPHFVAAATDDGRTTAELSPAEKHAISHRGVAFRLLAEHVGGLLET